MAEHLPEHARSQMPDILGRDSLGLIAVDQLAEDGVDTVADAAEQELQ